MKRVVRTALAFRRYQLASEELSRAERAAHDPDDPVSVTVRATKPLVSG